MKLGFVGLGKMGGNMVLRLVKGGPEGSPPGGHQVVGFAQEVNPDLAGVEGVEIVGRVRELFQKLAAPRVVWVMVPAGNPTEQVIKDLTAGLGAGDVIIDGGNSHYIDSLRRAQGLAARGIKFLDIGTSGGVWGRKEGYCMMVGGPVDAVKLVTPILETLAPPDGWAHVGDNGAGHFVKMVHNGIEYGLMEAYGEGFEVLFKSKFKLDLHQISKVWNRGSVVRSWLLELAEDAFAKDKSLKSIAPFVEDSGEGRWTIQAAIDEDVPTPVIAAALFARFASRDPYNLSARFSAALRNEFGGHTIRKAANVQIQNNGTVAAEKR
jgi:6-phosphogluconate dehydrogenase